MTLFRINTQGKPNLLSWTLLALFFLPLLAHATVDTFTSSTTWVAPPSVTSVQVEVFGPGGAGAATDGTFGGGGGGGGAYAKLNTLAVTPGNSYTVTITAGADAWFSTSGTVLAKRGLPGVSGGAGGVGGTAAASIGDVKFGGGTGGIDSLSNGNAGGGGSSAGTAANGTNGGNNGGAGGTAPSGGGNGGTMGGSPFNGSAGSAPGGGGGGGGAPGGSGGAGATGKIVLTYTVAKPPGQFPRGAFDWDGCNEGSAWCGYLAQLHASEAAVTPINTAAITVGRHFPVVKGEGYLCYWEETESHRVTPSSFERAPRLQALSCPDYWQALAQFLADWPNQQERHSYELTKSVMECWFNDPCGTPQRKER